MDTPTVQIPSFGSMPSPPNLGASYAAGMEAGSKVGENIGKGISTAFDIYAQNRTADDTLSAMKQSGILSADAYNAVAGKSLGAKQQMLGMYASQWIAQQTAQREIAKTVAERQITDPGKFPVARSTTPPPAAPPAGSGGGPPPLPAGITPLVSPDVNITNPMGQSRESIKVTMGAPIGGKGQIPKDWVPHQGPGGQFGYMENPNSWNPIFHAFNPGPVPGPPSQFGGS